MEVDVHGVGQAEGSEGGEQQQGLQQRVPATHVRAQVRVLDLQVGDVLRGMMEDERGCVCRGGWGWEKAQRDESYVSVSGGAVLNKSYVQFEYLFTHFLFL